MATVPAVEVRPAPAAAKPARRFDQPGTTSLLGVKLTPVARDAVLVALLAIAAGLLAVALIVADHLGLGPRRRLLARRRQLL